MGIVTTFIIGTDIIGDHKLTLHPPSSFTFTLNCVVFVIFEYVIGLVVEKTEFDILIHVLLSLYWNLYLLTGIEVLAVN